GAHRTPARAGPDERPDPGSDRRREQLRRAVRTPLREPRPVERATHRASQAAARSARKLLTCPAKRLALTTRESLRPTRKEPDPNVREHLGQPRLQLRRRVCDL